MKIYIENRLKINSNELKMEVVKDVKKIVKMV